MNETLMNSVMPNCYSNERHKNVGELSQSRRSSRHADLHSFAVSFLYKLAAEAITPIHKINTFVSIPRFSFLVFCK